MELTKDMFKNDINVSRLLISSREIIFNGSCSEHKCLILCGNCPLCFENRNSFKKSCLAMEGPNEPLSFFSIEFKSRCRELCTQFIKLYEVPKTHHVNFMEEG
jgi:hypothetical protein